MINLNDYAHTAAQRGWGSGWPGCGNAGNIATVTTSSGVRLPVHARLARLVLVLANETERRGYHLVPGWCWGYACRAISGTRVASNHSWGLAVDLNAPRNPYTSPLRTDMPAWVPQLWNSYGFAWGGDYDGPYDAMHYEFMGTPADADLMTAAAIAAFTIPPVHREDDPVSLLPLPIAADGSFRAATTVECGDTSLVVARAWITVGSTFAPATFKVTAIDGNARPLKQLSFTVGVNGTAFMELPNTTKLATVEGHVTAGALPCASLVSLPKAA